jgi:hypothetical protein
MEDMLVKTLVKIFKLQFKWIFLDVYSPLALSFQVNESEVSREIIVGDLGSYFISFAISQIDKKLLLLSKY